MSRFTGMNRRLLTWSIIGMVLGPIAIVVAVLYARSDTMCGNDAMSPGQSCQVTYSGGTSNYEDYAEASEDQAIKTAVLFPVGVIGTLGGVALFVWLYRSDDPSGNRQRGEDGQYRA